MKINRHGKARLLTPDELVRLFNDGLTNIRDRTLFAICLFTAARINEACTLHTQDIYSPRGQVRPELILRKQHTKGKLGSRTIPVIPDLYSYLEEYHPEAGCIWLFPGGRHRNRSQPLDRDSASRILRKALIKIGLDGASTHSMRRTALTQMNNTGIPLRTIQEISGHRDLQQLQCYLEITGEQVLGAVSTLSSLSPRRAS